MLSILDWLQRCVKGFADSVCPVARKFVANSQISFRDRLFRSAGEGTKIGDNRDGIFVFQMVDVHRRTDRFAVCADSFFENIQPIPI